MWALFAVIVAFLLRGIPGAYWLLIGALVVFVTAFILSTRGGPSAAQVSEKRWRGQPLQPLRTKLARRIKAFLKGRKRA